MRRKLTWQQRKILLRRWLWKTWYQIKSWNWLNTVLLIINTFIVYWVYEVIHDGKFDKKDTLTNILTVNGVFSAILITYLFTRITWTKDRKLERYNQAQDYSQKVTEIRRIFDKLTNYYNVWVDDKATKNLLDYSKYQHVDYYDYRLSSISDYRPKNYALIRKIFDEPNYREGITNVYLAMVSLVKDRSREWYWQQELYKDFKTEGVYNIKWVEKWIECEVFTSLSHWFSRGTPIIFYNLSKEKNELKAAATRINEKYATYEFDEKLIRELSDDFANHYMPELYKCLQELSKGVQSLSLTIMYLVALSLIFGVLAPLLLLVIDNTLPTYAFKVETITAINAGLIGFFIMKFPFLIAKELRWV